MYVCKIKQTKDFASLKKIIYEGQFNVIIIVIVILILILILIIIIIIKTETAYQNMCKKYGSTESHLLKLQKSDKYM